MRDISQTSTGRLLSRLREMDFLSSILVQKLILYFLLYLFGLLGFGNVYFFFFFFLACVWISIKTCNEAEATKFRPDIWWLEDNLVERVDWLNQILKQFWPNVISCLQLTLNQIPNGEIIKKRKSRFDKMFIFRKSHEMDRIERDKTRPRGHVEESPKDRRSSNQQPWR